MYNNQVRVGNWVEDQNGAFALQKDGTKDSVYQKDYGKRAMQARECKTIWKIREKGQGLPRQLFRDHGIRNAYDGNMCTMYDLNCMSASVQSLDRRYNTHSKLWKPEKSFLPNHGPGRDELVKKKKQSWINDNLEFVTEYQCSYTH